jgi:hypothetical protein
MNPYGPGTNHLATGPTRNPMMMTHSHCIARTQWLEPAGVRIVLSEKETVDRDLANNTSATWSQPPPATRDERKLPRHIWGTPSRQAYRRAPD